MIPITKEYVKENQHRLIKKYGDDVHIFQMNLHKVEWFEKKHRDCEYYVTVSVLQPIYDSNSLPYPFKYRWMRRYHFKTLPSCFVFADTGLPVGY
jgi:hypothetical protein